MTFPAELYTQHCQFSLLVVMRLSRALLTNVRYNLKTKPIIVGTNELSIELDSSTVATVSFVKVDHQTYDLVHTLIPEQLQGQGLGHIFAQVCSL